MRYALFLIVLAFALSSVPPRFSGGQVADTPKVKQPAPPATALDTTGVQAQREGLQEEAKALQQELKKSRLTGAEIRRYARKIRETKVYAMPDSIAVKPSPDTVVMYFPRRILVPMETVDTELYGRTWFGAGRILIRRHLRDCKLHVLFEKNGWKNFWDRDYKPKRRS